MEMMVDVSNYKLMQTSLDSSEMKYFDFFFCPKAVLCCTVCEMREPLKMPPTWIKHEMVLMPVAFIHRNVHVFIVEELYYH